MLTNKSCNKAVSCSQKPKSDSEPAVSLMSIGPAGCGKSTIGNKFLSENQQNAEDEMFFQTSPGAQSCTHRVQAKTASDRTYIDAPSIPSVEPDHPVDNYNQCVNAIKKQKISALLFVFKMERIDVEKYQMAELLFREINKANCIKILVINDMTSLPFQKPDENQHRILAAKIQRVTKIHFAAGMAVNASNMKDKLDGLVNKLRESKVEPRSSPQLRNFSQVQKWVEYLQKTQDYRNAVLYQKNTQCDSVKKYAVHLGAFLNAVKFTAGFLFFSLAPPELIEYCSEMWGDDMTLKLTSTKKEIQIHENDNNMNQNADERIDEAITELRRAKDYFEQLSNLMRVQH